MYFFAFVKIAVIFVPFVDICHYIVIIIVVEVFLIFAITIALDIINNVLIDIVTLVVH